MRYNCVLAVRQRNILHATVLVLAQAYKNHLDIPTAVWQVRGSARAAQMALEFCSTGDVWSAVDALESVVDSV